MHTTTFSMHLMMDIDFFPCLGYYKQCSALMMINSIEHLFMHLLTTVYLLWKTVYSILLSMFQYVVCFLYIELYELFIYLGYQPLINHIIFKYFLPFIILPFILLMVSFAVQKLLSLIRFPLVLLLLFILL